MRWLFTLLLFLFTANPATADSQELRYTLSYQGESIGYRSLKIRFIPSTYGERRLLESWTEFQLPIGRKNFIYKQRLSGLAKSKNTGFTAAMSEDGHLREVQVVHQPERAVVTHVEYGRRWAIPVTHEKYDATSLTLIDPGAKGFLENLLQLRVLSAETGRVIAGKLGPKKNRILVIGGSKQQIEHYVWSTENGDIELAYSADGYLLQYSFPFGTQKILATLDQLPAPRSFEEDIPDPIIGVGMDEEKL